MGNPSLRLSEVLSWNARIFAQLKHPYYSLPNRQNLADERAEPRPDINIKVTAFSETNKLYNTLVNSKHPG